MKKIIARLYFLLKKDKKQTTPYLSTILLTGLFIVIHISIIRLALNLPDYIFNPISIKNEKISGWLNTIFILTPILLLVRFFFRKSELEKYQFYEQENRKWKKYFIFYSVALLSLLIVLLVIKGIQRGTI